MFAEPRPVLEAILAGGATFLITSLCMVGLYFDGISALKEEVRGGLVRTAKTVAALVDGDFHRTFTRPEQEASDDYRRAVAPLQKILRERGDIRFLYTMVLVNKLPCVVLDATPPGDADRDGVEDHSPIMQPYTTAAPALLDALQTGKAQADPEAVKDQWGTYFSAYAPFCDSAGRMAGVVGVDMRADNFAARMAVMKRSLRTGLITALVVCTVFGAGIWWLRERVRTMHRMRLAAEEELRLSEAKFRALTEHSPDVIMRFDREGRHLYVSPSVTRCFRSRPEDWIGKTHRELGFAPECCAFWEDNIRSVAQTGKAVEREYRMETAAGPAIFDIRLHPEPGPDNSLPTIYGVCRDISAHRRAEQHYQMIFNSMIEGVAVHEILCDDHGKPEDYRFLAVNPAFERLTGLKKEDVVGRTAREVVPGLEDVWIATYGKVALTGEPAHFENYAKNFGRWYEVIAYRPMPGQFVTIFSDVTERKRVAEERAHMEEQIRHVQKLESLGVLAGGIAHDFNNFLMAILGNADLAVEELPADSPARSSLVEIRSAALCAADLCKQMLAYSGKGSFVSKPMNLSDLIAGMTQLLEISVSKRAVLRLDLAADLPSIEADASQLRQVVLNLVINASEAIGDKSGAITVSTGAMECDEHYLRGAFQGELLTPGQYVFVEVADTGCGIDKAVQGRIFDPFFTTKFTGRGLGLAVVLGIVRRHGGAIHLHTQMNRGTEFRMLFPASRRTVAVDASSPAVDTWQGTGVILLVDDDETVRSVGKRMIERLGFRVLTAADGREGLEVFRAHLDTITCVLLDLTMPHMDGEAAFKELRRIRPDVRIILSSGYTEHDLSNRLSGLGVQEFIQKPYRLTQLREVLRETVEAGTIQFS